MSNAGQKYYIGKTLDDYRHLFPAATGIDYSVKRDASVEDTINFIPEAVEKCRWMVKRFVAQELKGMTLYDACEKLWDFTKYLIAYEKDELRKEQLKSASRLIADGKGDCDCKTLFVDTCLTEYGVRNGIINRITAYYGADNFSHIYSLIPNGNGKYIIMDCVWNRFNSEKKYTKKEDHIMELQFLDGLEDAKRPGASQTDSVDLMAAEEGELDLGKILRRASKKKHENNPAKQHKAKKKPFTKLSKKLIKGVHAVNKINPATLLLRAGILASMKLNVLKVAGALKWGYATREYAASKGMDMTKFDKVRKVLNKLEKIFYAAGGKPENLKKAILTGHGNKNHEVAGLFGIDETTPLATMLGAIYQDEFMNGMEGFGELGEPATATSLAAAATAIGTIAAVLKSIGNLFPHKNRSAPQAPSADTDNGSPDTDSAQDTTPPLLVPTGSNKEGADTIDPVKLATYEEEQAPEEAQEDAPSEYDTEDSTDNLPAAIENDPDQLPVPVESSDDGPQNASSDQEVNGFLPNPLTGIKDFYTNHKWILPATLAAGFVAAAFYYLNKQNPQLLPYNTPVPINGFKKKNRKKKRGGKRHNKPGEQSIIALM